MATFIQPDLTLDQIIGIATQPPTPSEIRLDAYKRFYAGVQDVKHSERQNLYLGEVDTTFPDAFVNVSELVVNVLLDRLSIVPDGLGITPMNDASRDYAQIVADWWVDLDLNSIQNEIHELVLRDGAAAMFVEWSESGMPRFTPEAIYDGNSGVRFKTSDLDDDIVEWAAKIWYTNEYDIDGKVKDTYQRLNLYLPGELYRYWTRLEGGLNPQAYELLTPEQVANETGGATNQNPQRIPIMSLPIIRFQNNPNKSEIDQIFKLQKLITKSASDIDIGSDMHAAPLLVGEDGLSDNLEIGPAKGIQGKNIQRIEPPNLELMWDGSILKWIDMVSLVKRWPMYLLNPREFSVPSGKALDALERSLVNQLKKKSNDLDKVWQQTFSVAREWFNLANSGASISVDAQIRLEWEAPNIENATEEQQTQVQTARNANLPDTAIWEQVYGMSQEQIEETLEKRRESVQYKQEVATLLETLTRALIPVNQAVEFVGEGLDDDQALQLTEVRVNGSGNTSFSERLANAGNGQPNANQPEG